MKKVIEKGAYVAVCQKCRGTGKVYGLIRSKAKECPQCEGSGRVVVTSRTELEIEPYKEND